MKKIIYLALIAVIMGFFSTGCEKENLSPNNNQTITEINTAKGKRPSLAQLAAILGISVEAIVSVDYKSGNYSCEEETITWPDGTVQKKNKIKCGWQFWQFCCAIVHFNVQTKVEDSYNGYVGFSVNKENNIEKLYLIFDQELLGNVSWLQDNYISLDHDLPLVNAEIFNLCNDKSYLMIPAGDYDLCSWGTYKFFEIEASELLIQEGIIEI